MNRSAPGKRRRSSATRGQVRRQSTIDGVIVEEVFSLSYPPDDYSRVQATTKPPADDSNGENKADDAVGDACYITATVHNRKFYGILVDQACLKAASEKFFENEAASLQLNQRMATLLRQRQSTSENNCNHKNLDVPTDTVRRDKKRIMDVEESPQFVAKKLKLSLAEQKNKFNIGESNQRHVQKFRYFPASSNYPGYRVLVATYSDVLAASHGDPIVAKKINEALRCGGNFVDDFYYHYETAFPSLISSLANEYDARDGIRTSMGIHYFLYNTMMPPWYPLSNSKCNSQKKVLSMLQLKKNHNGKVQWDSTSSIVSRNANLSRSHLTMLPFKPRTSFEIGVVGGGIAGLACCAELLRLSKETGVEIKVILFEARSRLGGRILTDVDTFKANDGKETYPVDLGAAWIHGINKNPLHSIAKEAGGSLITTSEDVKMLCGGMGVIAKESDIRMSNLFNKLLDEGSADCWARNQLGSEHERKQTAVRWYGEILQENVSFTETPVTSTPRPNNTIPVATDIPPHRFSADTSLGNSLCDSMKRRTWLLKKLYEDKRNLHLLQWASKNVEYALGADIFDLSMRYWDADEEYAFEGDHVLIKEGYSTIISFLLKRCQEYGTHFQHFVNCPVQKIEYSRMTQSQPYTGVNRSKLRPIQLSDACRVTCRDGKSYNFDFVVSALPLGVLKASIHNASHDRESKARPNKVYFEPPLPESKSDAINSVGFGLLNKIFLQFPHAFWRKTESCGPPDKSPYLGPGENIFGNASGYNPHHYMFLDIGASLRKDLSPSDAPGILLTMISGSQAVFAEQKPDNAIISEVMSTLKHLFSKEEIPHPIASKITRWGSDEFSRGCYTFLPVGASDEDYHLLQSPVNGNGESFMLNSNETLRLFWAGEHTTSLHPSMSHGAYLSGVRAATEVVSNMIPPQNPEDSINEREIPLSVYRRNNPKLFIKCSLCHSAKNRGREGAILVFRKGNRYNVVHSNCALFSPEIGLNDGSWSNVSKACTRGRKLNCSLCGNNGATIGCAEVGCRVSFHFKCAEGSGWDFEKQGKNFLCDFHRGQSRGDDSECLADDQISVDFFRLRNPSSPLICSLCQVEGDCKKSGKLLGFQRGSNRILAHYKCLKFTSVVDTVVDTVVDEGSEERSRFKNIFEAVAQSSTCSHCNIKGASIRCCDDNSQIYHFKCAKKLGDFEIHEGRYIWSRRHEREKPSETEIDIPYRHNLLGNGTSSPSNQTLAQKIRSAKMSLPANDFLPNTSNSFFGVDFDNVDGETEVVEPGNEGANDDKVNISDILSLVLPVRH